MVQRSRVTDCSGRKFQSISAFEYALWALDKHMWTALLNYIPKGHAHSSLWGQLLTQYQQLKTQGVTYQLHGKTIIEQHFDFQHTIIDALQTQVNLYQAPGYKDFDILDTQWRDGVGGAQKLLPMHVVAEYCSNEPFHPVPEFIAPPQPTNGLRIGKKNEPWFSVKCKLGEGFAACKGGRAYAARTPNVLGWLITQGAPRDLAAMTKLYSVRTQDLIMLQAQLEDHLAPNSASTSTASFKKQ
ncbi:MAG: F-box protein [Legionella sp.]|mgnify:CR=1 FL=1|nr:F-box protein [Legionella sp.]